MESQTWSETAVIASNVFRGTWGVTELPLTCEERTQIGKSLLALFRESPVLIPTYKAVDAAGLGTVYEASRNAGILNEAPSVPRETPIPPPPLIHDAREIKHWIIQRLGWPQSLQLLNGNHRPGCLLD